MVVVVEGLSPTSKLCVCLIFVRLEQSMGRTKDPIRCICGRVAVKASLRWCQLIEFFVKGSFQQFGSCTNVVTNLESDGRLLLVRYL